MGVPTSGDNNRGGGVGVYESLCIEDAEYGCTPHCVMANSGPLQGDGAEIWGMGFKDMMGEIYTGPSRHKGGGGGVSGRGRRQ